MSRHRGKKKNRQPFGKAQPASAPASPTRIPTPPGAAASRRNALLTVPIGPENLQSPRRIWTDPISQAVDLLGRKELPVNETFELNGVSTDRRASIGSATDFYSRPDCGTRCVTTTSRSSTDIDCPVLFLSFEGNANFMGKLRRYIDSEDKLRDEDKSDSQQGRVVAPNEWVGSFETDSDTEKKKVSITTKINRALGDLKYQKIVPITHEIIALKTTPPDELISLGNQITKAVQNIATASDPVSETDKIKLWLEELINLAVSPKPTHPHIEPVFGSEMAVDVTRTWPLLKDVKAALDKLEKEKNGERSRIISAFYNQILHDQLTTLGFNANTTQRQGLPRLIFLCEEPLTHPSELVFNDKKWIAETEANNMHENISRDVQLITCYRRSDEDIGVRFAKKEIGNSQSVVVRIQDRIVIAGVHMDSDFTTGTKDATTRLANINKFKNTNEDWDGFYPDVVLGDLNLDSTGLPHGVYTSEEVENHTGNYSVIPKSNQAGDKNYMGGFSTTESIKSVPTAKTFGKRWLLQVTTLPMGVSTAFGITNWSKNKLYVYSDHPSLYGNFSKFNPVTSASSSLSLGIAAPFSTLTAIPSTTPFMAPTTITATNKIPAVAEELMGSESPSTTSPTAAPNEKKAKTGGNNTADLHFSGIDPPKIPLPGDSSTPFNKSSDDIEMDAIARRSQKRERSQNEQKDPDNPLDN